MKNAVLKFLEEKIDFIKKTEKPYGILLVGSSRKILEGSEAINSDIDIFVITGSGNFEREVFFKYGVEYDISYISLDELKSGIERELHSLIPVLANAKAILLKPEAKSLLGNIESIYDKGPKKKDDSFMRYKRFKLTKSLDTVEKKLNSEEFDFLIYNYLRELLVFYFEIEGKWIPSDKKLIGSIEDQKLRVYVKEILKSSENKKKLKSLKQAADHIMDPLSGAVDEWEKSAYPFDFN